MRRRPSGSNSEEDGDQPTPIQPNSTPQELAIHGGEEKRRPADASPLGGAGHRGASIPTSRSPHRAAINNLRDWKAPEATTSAVDHGPNNSDGMNGRMHGEDMADLMKRRKNRLRSPWATSLSTLFATLVSALLVYAIVQSFLTRQLDPKGCVLSYMRPAFAKYNDFDTEHTRFASKYSLYLYREGGIDEDTRVKGIPVLFIPGNAGSYKQVRPLAAEAAEYFHNVLRHDENAIKDGKRTLDFFSVDFNEDITAFHGQTLLDQAEYLNEAIAFILKLYHDPNRSLREPGLPDPSSVMIIGHSMGGIVARTMLTMPNYQTNSINTIVTLSAPHGRAPVSFDADIIKTYARINKYWRDAHSQQWANKNPLWHVTLVSIAGGGLDTMVPSEYSSLASIVPPTHGFTVFTSSIPNVWTGMDHLAIMWCDQFRKSVIRALYDVADVRRPSQTQPRAERMRFFKKRFLTGMEDVSEKLLPQEEPRTLLTLEDNANAIVSQGERLVLRELGHARKPRAHLLPVPFQESNEGSKFTLLTNQPIDSNGPLEILFCSVFPLQSGQSSNLFSMNMDLSGDSTGSTRLACKNGAADVIPLPASTQDSKYPFDHMPAWSYLQYDLEDLAEHQFVAVVDKAREPTPGWVMAEFSTTSQSTIRTNVSLRSLVTSNLEIVLSGARPMVNNIKIPALYSGLLSYKVNIDKQSSSNDMELFSPLLRQYVSEPYESKYFVNVEDADVNIHGVAPFMPPPLQGISAAEGLSLQIWTDPTATSSLKISLKLDFIGSVGKLVMRYRTVSAAFPLLVVALVLRKQFIAYDATGIFMPFSEALDSCLKTSLPVLFVVLTFIATSLANSAQRARSATMNGSLDANRNATESALRFTQNDLLLGSQDPFFWFLVPLFGLISVGICVVVNYATLIITHVLAFAYSKIRAVSPKSNDGKRTPTAFAVTSLPQRVITTAFLVLLVSTVIPYQFAYMVLCIVQVATSTRALRLLWETRAAANYNFFNYAHSLLVLMLWVLPINLPVLVVWVHNLAVHWLTPFSSHHNILSVTPFILLVETLSTGRMIPRVTTRVRHITTTLFLLVAFYAAIYGVSYAYLLHHLANMLAAWLFAIHIGDSSFDFHRLSHILDEGGNGGTFTVGGRREKKRP
ncbi:MAG: GPI inositol deacylase [Bogoriella megaspora]|nr:MAG: GPI inositol deacylase [Bogoriella megaspora]